MRALRRVLLLSLLLLCVSLGSAAAEPVLRIAVLPVLDETGGWLDRDGAEALQKQLYEEARIPLNDCLQIAAYVPPEEGVPVLRRLEAEQRQATGKKRTDDRLLAPQLAEALQADLVFYLRVKTYYQRRYYSFREGPQVESVVHLRLAGFDRRAGRLIHESATRHEHGDYSPSLDVDVLAQDALYSLLQQAKIKNAIFPLTDKL